MASVWEAGEFWLVISAVTLKPNGEATVELRTTASYIFRISCSVLMDDALKT